MWRRSAWQTCVAFPMAEAIDWLKKKGLRSMEKRTAESVEALLALGIQQAGVIVELRAARLEWLPHTMFTSLSLNYHPTFTRSSYDFT